MHKRNLLILACLLLIAIIGYVAYLWFKPHRDIQDQSYIALNAKDLFKAFDENESGANTLYLDKALEVNGEILEIRDNQAGQKVVILKTDDPIFGVACTFRESPGELQTGQAITIKGFCSGYASDVVLRDCIISRTL